MRLHPTAIRTVVDLLQRRAEEHPDRRAFTFLEDVEPGESHVTYGELDQRARVIAARLAEIGAGGERALLLYPSGLDYIAAFFGCLYAGAIAVPAYPPDPRALQRTLPRLEALVRDAEPCVALTTTAILAPARALAAALPGMASLRWLATDDLDGASSPWRPPVVGPESLAFLQYTSGSTDTPRGVMLTHRNLLENERMIARAFRQGADNIGLGWLPLYHDMGLIGNILQPIYAGSQCVLMSPIAFLQRPARWLRAITSFRADSSGAPNFAYELCVRKVTAEERAELDLSSWSLAFCGAEPIRQETLDRFAAAFEPCGFRRSSFLPCYGLAEATLFVSGGFAGDSGTSRRVRQENLERGAAVEDERGTPVVSCGPPADGVEVAIVDPASRERCRAGQIGEIWVSAPTVARGYWRAPETTAEVFHATLATGGGPFLRTGDLGFALDGQLFVTGRLKDLLIIRGRNVAPHDIESTVEKCHPALRPGCGAAFGVDVEQEEQLVVVQELDHRRAADVDEVVEHIRAAVAERHQLHVHAVVLVRAGTIPKTSSGKIRRRDCKAEFVAGRLAAVATSVAGAHVESGEGAPAREPAEEDEIERADESGRPRRRRAEPGAARPRQPGSGEADSAVAKAWRPRSGEADSTAAKAWQPRSGEADSTAATAWQPGSGEADSAVSKAWRPGSDETVYERVVALLARRAGVSPSKIDRSASITSLGMDSLGAAELQVDLRAAFGVLVPLAELLAGPSIGALVGLLEQRDLVDDPAAAASEPPPIARRAQAGEHPLSFGQERLWFLSELDPTSTAYHLPAAVRLRGKIDVGALARSFGALVRRHESLRTRFVRQGDRVVQVVDEARPIALEVVPVAVEVMPAAVEVMPAAVEVMPAAVEVMPAAVEVMPAAVEVMPSRLEVVRTALEAVPGDEAALGAQIEERVRAPFDLGRGPLLRLTLFRRSAEEAVLVVVMHHIITDGWSIGRLIGDLAELYSAELSGRPAELPELPVRYTDYAVWQRHWMQGEVLARHTSYWRKQLAGAPSVLDLPTDAPSVLDLPTDAPHPEVSSSAGARLPVVLEPELVAALERLCRAEGATLFMALLAAYGALLSAYAGQPEVLIGTPVANRTRPEVEGVVGLFVNTLVMRVDVSDQPTVRELLARIRAMALGAYAHQELPLEKVIDAVQPERSLGVSPLFQVMLAMQNRPPPTLRLEQLDVEVTQLDRGAAQFDLSLNLEPDGAGGLRGSLEYRVDLFREQTAAEMARRWRDLLDDFVREPDRRVDELSLPTDTRRGSGQHERRRADRPVELRVLKPEAMEPEAAGQNAGPRGGEPLGDIERLIGAVWREVLGTEGIGRDDNFFDLGGNSLLATQVVARLQRQHAADLSVRDVFAGPTVAGLAARLEQADRRARGADFFDGEQADRRARDANMFDGADIFGDADIFDGGPLRAAQTASGVGRAFEAEAPVLAVDRASIEARGEHPLSFAQERLWFLAELDPTSTAYHLPAAVRLRGRIDVGALERSFGALVRRHESLRTRFERRGDRVVQVVDEARPVALEVVPVDEADLRAQTEDRVRAPFDLGRGPLLRLTLFRRSAEEAVLVVVMHHIITDGWSIGRLVGDLVELYSAELAGRRAELPELAVRYADYAAWQREWMQGEVLARETSYWQAQLGGAPPVLDLPTDAPRRPAVPSTVGARLPIAIEPEVVTALERLCRAEGVTLFMALLAAYGAILSRYAEQTEVLVGTPVANRTRPEVEGVVGLFVNTLVMRVRLAGRPTVRELLARVRAMALGAYAHQELPLEKVIDALQPERSLGVSPLFQVMLALQNTPQPALRLEQLDVEVTELDRGASQFDLTLNLEPDGVGGLRGSFEHRADLFDEQTVAGIARRWRAVLDGFIGSPDGRVDELSLSTDAERRQVLAWSRTESLPAMCDPDPEACGGALHRLVEARARLAPEAVAVVHGDAVVTCGELDRRATGVAECLRARGVARGEIVAIAADRSIDMIAAQLGVLKAGAAFVPVDPRHPAERIRFLFDDARVGLVLLATAAPVDHLPVHVQRIAVAEIPAAARAVAGAVVSPGDVAYVMYTSGSSGQPKGVMVPHGAVCNELCSFHARFPLFPGDRFLQRASPTFDASLSETYPALLAGAAVVIGDEATPYDPAAVFGAMVKHDITAITVVPTFLRHLLDDRFDSVPVRLRRLQVVGEQLTTELAGRAAARFGCEVLNGYGPTETAIEVSSHAFDAGRGSRGRASPSASTPSGAVVPIGSPIHGVRVYVLDEVGQPVPPGMRGELYVGGVSLAHGYLGRPALTAERFVPDPFSQVDGARLYRTGDRVRHLPDGTLEYVGRADDQVKLRGMRLELGEVEAGLLRCPGVAQAAAAVRAVPEQNDDDRGPARGQDLVGYVVLAPAGELAAVRAALANELPAPIRPSVLVALVSLPVTSSGKLDRAALPAPSVADRAELSRRGGPLSETERLISAVWTEVLGIEGIGRDDNFFEIGGNSLLATRVLTRLLDRRAVGLSVRDIFERPRLADLATRLDEVERPEDAAPERGLRLEAASATLARLDEMDEEQLDALLEQLGGDDGG